MSKRNVSSFYVHNTYYVLEQALFSESIVPKNYFEIASISKNRSLNVRVFTVGAKSGEYGGQSIFIDDSHGNSGIVS